MGKLGFLFFCTLFVAVYSLPGADWESKLLSRIDTEQETATCRYEGSGGAVTVLGIVVTDPVNGLYCRAGISSPFLLIGPLQYAGVFREIDSTALLSADSDLFEEKSELTLNTSAEPVSSFGAAVGNLGMQQFFFITATRDGNVRGGGCFTFYPAPELYLGLIHQMSWGYSAAEESDWFTRRPSPVRGVLYHSAGTFSFYSDAFRLGSMLCVSGGLYIPHGVSARLSSNLRLPFVSLAGYMRVKTIQFISTDGKYPDDYITFSIEGMLPVSTLGSITVIYGGQIFHPHLFPGMYVESREKIEIEVAVLLGRTKVLAGWRRNVDVERWGDYAVLDAYCGKIKLSGRNVRCTLSGEYSVDEERRNVAALKSDLSLKKGKGRVALSLGAEFTEEVNLDGSIKGTYRLSWGSVTAGVSLSGLIIGEKNAPFTLPPPGITLEWKTKQKHPGGEDRE